MTSPPPGLAKYPHLFAPGRIRRRDIRNRIVLAPHSTNLGEQGRPTDRQIAYYRARAAGGVGLIILGGVRIHPTTVSSARALRGYEPGAVPDFARLAEAVHAEGAAIVAQLLHVGREVTTQESGRPLWSASDRASPMQRETPHRMSRADIQECLEHYAISARHMRQAGFDGVEIHAAHGYLVQQFLSPLVNDRDDEYGGPIENRLRLAREVIAATRSEAGDLMVGIRISGDEFIEGGLHLEDMVAIAPELAAAGVDYISVSHCTYVGPSFVTMIPDMHQPRGAYVYLAEAIKAAVPSTVPVFTVGRITEAAMADDIVGSGRADYVAMARALIADPELPVKALQGREDQILPCIACNQGCVGMVHALRPILCLQNPITGRELELGEPTPADPPRRVLVIGGGIAGLEAAITARRRGHDVTIWENTAGLGGMARWASLPLGREDFRGTYTWRKSEVQRLGVHVRLGKHATAEDVIAFAPDVVILATGARPAEEEYLELLPGADPGQILSVERMIIEAIDPGQHVLFVDDDGHHRAAGVAEGLARRGKRVLIVTALPAVGADIIPMSAIGVQLRLKELGVQMFPASRVSRVNGWQAEITHVASGQTTVVDNLDALVVAGRRRANDDLYAPLAARLPRVLLAGDCQAPRRALDAIRDGHLAGRLA